MDNEFTTNDIPKRFTMLMEDFLNLVKERDRLREALKKIADIKHEDLPSPITPNEANVWTVLAMTIGLADKVLKESK